MFSMMWQKINKLKQKGVIQFNKISWLRWLTAKLWSVRCQMYGQVYGIKCLKDKFFKLENFVCDLIFSGRLLKVIAILFRKLLSLLLSAMRFTIHTTSERTMKQSDNYGLKLCYQIVWKFNFHFVIHRPLDNDHTSLEVITVSLTGLSSKISCTRIEMRIRI